jgi:hypothetical protein
MTFHEKIGLPVNQSPVPQLDLSIVPEPFRNYFTYEKKLSEFSFVAKCDALGKNVVFKLLKGQKQYY